MNRDGTDFMPLHGVDYVELWVGNAAQAAFFYREALGFTQIASAGLRERPARPGPLRARSG